MRMIQDCEKRDAVPEILAFTFVQLCTHPCQLKETSKNRETNR